MPEVFLDDYQWFMCWIYPFFPRVGHVFASKRGKCWKSNSDTTIPFTRGVKTNKLFITDQGPSWRILSLSSASSKGKRNTLLFLWSMWKWALVLYATIRMLATIVALMDFSWIILPTRHLILLVLESLKPSSRSKISKLAIIKEDLRRKQSWHRDETERTEENEYKRRVENKETKVSVVEEEKVKRGKVKPLRAFLLF